MKLYFCEEIDKRSAIDGCYQTSTALLSNKLFVHDQ